MKNRKIDPWAVNAVAVAGVIVLVSGCILLKKVDNAKEIRMDQLPVAVKAAAERETAGCKIIEVEEESKDGKTIYTVSYEEKGKEMELEYSKDGKLLSKGLE